MKLLLVLALALVAGAQGCEDRMAKHDPHACGFAEHLCATHKYIRDACEKTCRVCSPPTRVPPRPGTLPPMDQCGVPKVQTGRVIGGDDAKRGAWPWQVLMLKNGRAGCGGTLISPQWVVSAAHCVSRDTNYPQRFKIRVGENDRSTKEGSEVDMAVERVIAHPQYNSRKLDYDIALFKLAKPVMYNTYVQPACMPSQDLAPGTECYITGWGKTRHPGSMTMGKLQEANLPIVSNKVCYAKNKKFIPIPITDRMVCGGEGGVNPKSGCHGDSGGPFVCKVNGKWELHGDVSHGSPRCKSTETYTVFARTYYFKQWIFEQMRKYAN